MKYFPPERTQEELDVAGAYRLPTHWDTLECLRSLAGKLHAVGANTNDPRRRTKMLAFSAVVAAIHDSLGLEDNEGITLDYFDKGPRVILGEREESSGIH